MATRDTGSAPFVAAHDEEDLALAAIDLVRKWLEADKAPRPLLPTGRPQAGKPRAGKAKKSDDEESSKDRAAERLAGLLRDPNGLDFAVGFVDGVARPRDPWVATKNLRELARIVPRSLTPAERAALLAGGTVAPAAPHVVIPIARRVLRSMVGHLVIDASPRRLGKAIAYLKAGGATGGASRGAAAGTTGGTTGNTAGGTGVRLNLSLLGEAVLGDREADARLEGTRRLLERDDVDYVSIKVSNVVSRLSLWAFEESVARIVQRLTPLYLYAAQSPTPKFINLDMEEYHDLDLTIAVFTALLGDPRLRDLEAGIVLQAYLPDALDRLQGLTEWAQNRCAAGGAAIKVRLVKGANLPMERVDAALHGWPLAPYDGKVHTDANYKRVLDWALTPERTRAVKLGVAGHNLFDVAYAWLLARRRGVQQRIDFEMLLGMTPEQADAVARTVGGLLLYAPVVDPKHFDSAIAYLMRRLQENASDDDFLSAAFELGESPDLFEREKARFLAAVAEFEADDGVHGLAPLPNRRQDRVREWIDTDPTSMFHLRPAPVDPASRAEQDGLTVAVLGLERGHRDSFFPTEVVFSDTAPLPLLDRVELLIGDPAAIAEDADGPAEDDAAGDEERVRDTAELPDELMEQDDAEQEDAERDDSVDDDSDDESEAGPGAEASAGPTPERATEPLTMPRAEPELSRAEPELSGGASTFEFRNESDTDPALAANRTWARRVLAAAQDSTLGEQTLADARVSEQTALDALLAGVQKMGEYWGSISGAARGAALDRVGLALSANRDRLIEVMVAETGKTIGEADPEVSEAVDFAHYYAALARELDTVQGATFVPAKLTVATPPWNFPISIAAGSVLGPLAAGSGVVLKPAPQARRCGAVLAECLWEAGIPRDLFRLADLDEDELGKSLITDPRVERVVLTGSYETARLFASWRPELPLLAETSGKNAIVVTPSADVDLAVNDIVTSAFGNAGQKCSAASLVILVGTMGSSKRFLEQLVDATQSIRVGAADDPDTWMGPLVEPAAGKLERALTRLEQGEKWLVQPRRIDADGRLWSPGIRTGVQPGSEFHTTEYFGPVLGVMHAKTLQQAVEWQNAVDYGLTAGLHSLDSDEIGYWAQAVRAGNLYVNRGITGAVVQRQPFGGWKKSSVGAGFKAGGPNYLFGLGTWVGDSGAASASLHLRGLDSLVKRLIEAGQSSMAYEQFDLVRRSALSDAIAWATEFGQVHDPAGLGVERNVFRYRRARTSIRLAEGVSLPALLRVLAAATLVRGRFDVSTPEELPRGVREALHEAGAHEVVESDAEWLDRVAEHGAAVDPDAHSERIRLLGGDAVALHRALGDRLDTAVFSGPVTASGRVELLPFLKEQAISITNHRYGSPVRLGAIDL
jgi:RHH-type proline utilization regulon transcriptional repressor/proline dehydrogenase/delta 1-pyrroline-5-carboxylate dehydrogenase